MLSCDRRLGNRIPLEVFLTQYVDDRPRRGLAVDLSDTGIFVQTAKPPRRGQSAPSGPIALEIALPGTDEVIWASGRVCYQRVDGMVVGWGIRFTAMARAHARLIRDYCAEARRVHLTRLLDRIRN